MDPISHTVVTAVLLDRRAKTLLVALSPDLPWYLLYPVWLLAKSSARSALRSGDWPMPPRWLQEIHYAAHSLVVLGSVLSVSRLLERGENRLAWAWLLHILLDIPTHSQPRMAPRIFWPLSRWSFDGFSWADGATRLLASLLAKRWPGP